MEQEKIEKIARNLSSWLEDAMGDLADGSVAFGGSDEYNKWVKETGYSVHPNYRKESFADYLYNDIATLRDLLGDRIHDEVDCKYGTEEFNSTFIAIAEKIEENGHPALKEACKQLANRRR